MNLFRVFRAYCMSLSIERGRQVSLPYAAGHLLGSAGGLLYGNFFRKFGTRPLPWALYVLVLLVSVGPVVDAEGVARWLLGITWFFGYFLVLPAMIWLIDVNERRTSGR